MIFVGLLSVVFLKKRLEWFRWTGMAVVVCGIAMVGGADFIKTGEEEEGGAVNKAVVGDIIIVCAQVSGSLVKMYHQNVFSWWLPASLSMRRSTSPSMTFTHLRYIITIHQFTLKITRT